MNDKEANIDLLFRNGLKDFEVLPPPGVWDGIRSSGRVKARPLIVYRIAAVIAVLVTVSLLTYRWSREMPIATQSEIAFNVNTPSPVISEPLIVSPGYSSSKQIMIPVNINAISDENDLPVSYNNDKESIETPDQILNYRIDKGLSLQNESGRVNLLTRQKAFYGNSINIRYADLQYLPEKILKQENRWSIGAMASPTYYSRFNSGNDELSKQLMESEQAVMSYTGGLAFSYKISKRFSIQSGIYYSSLGQKVDGINSFQGFKPYDNSKGDYNFEVLTTSGTVQTSNPDVFLNSDASNRIITAYTSDIFDPKKASLQYLSSSLTQSFSYLELPVILRYKIVDKTIGINLIGGLSYNLLVHNAVYTTIDGNKYTIGDTKGLNPLTLSSSLGMGMEYNFSEKLSLNLEPTFRYYLNPFSVTTGTFIHPYSFGIFSGVSYKF
jgi:hypothetical protein